MVFSCRIKSNEGYQTGGKGQEHRDREQPEQEPGTAVDGKRDKRDGKQDHAPKIKRFFREELPDLTEPVIGIDRGGNPDRDIQEEVQPPVDHRQETADDRADHKRPCHDHRQDTHCLAQLVPGKGIDDDDDTVGDDDRTTDCLDDAKPDELGDIAGKSAEERADGEDRQAR